MLNWAAILVLLTHCHDHIKKLNNAIILLTSPDNEQTYQQKFKLLFTCKFGSHARDQFVNSCSL